MEINHKTGRQREFKVTGVVEGWERIDVPARLFEALKIVLQTEIVEGGQRSHSTDISWYEPAPAGEKCRWLPAARREH